MGVVIAITAKDLRQRLHDSSAIVMAFILPVVLAWVFANIIGGATTPKVTMVVADEDHGPLATAFTKQVLPDLTRRDVARKIVTAKDEAAARKLLADGKADAGWVIPGGFSEADARNERSTLTVVTTGDKQLAGFVAKAVADGMANTIYTARLSAIAASDIGGDLAAGRIPQEPTAEEGKRIGELAMQAGAQPAAVQIDDRSADKRELEPTAYYAAGMSVFFLFFSVAFAVTGLLEERRDGTLARMLAAPVTRTAILVGKLGAAVVLGLVSMTVLIVVSHVAMDVTWGAPLGVALLVVSGVLSATAFAALVGTLASDVEQAGAWQSMVALVLGMLGGSFFPVAHGGGVISALTLATPHAWFLRGLGELQAGSSWTAALGPAGAIMLITAIVSTITFLRIGKLARP